MKEARCRFGDETVGVRIAVRDMAPSADGKPDSQIYNWGIKKDAVLGGGRPGVNPNTTGASSSASSGTTLGGGRPGKNASSPHASSVASNDSIGVPLEIVNTGEEAYTEYIRQLREVQERVRLEELRQEYLRNMARLEEAEREAEMDAAFWKYWD